MTILVMRGKYPAKSFPGFFPGKTAFTDRGWTRINADESAAGICVCLRSSAVPHMQIPENIWPGIYKLKSDTFSLQTPGCQCPGAEISVPAKKSGTGPAASEVHPRSADYVKPQMSADKTCTVKLHHCKVSFLSIKTKSTIRLSIRRTSSNILIQMQKMNKLRRCLM